MTDEMVVRYAVGVEWNPDYVDQNGGDVTAPAVDQYEPEAILYGPFVDRDAAEAFVGRITGYDAVTILEQHDPS